MRGTFRNLKAIFLDPTSDNEQKINKIVCMSLASEIVQLNNIFLFFNKMKLTFSAI